jgi:RNA polymerase-associated protein RTF1
MDIMSNGGFTEDEFRRYESVLRSEKIDLMTQDHVENKRKDIEHAKEYVLSDKEVEAILELKRQMKQGRLNPVVHRTILEQQMMAQTHEEAEETERRLQELKEAELAQKNLRSDKLDLWAKLNERNRNLNRTTGREAEGRMAEQKKQKGSAMRDVDPFARRKTVPKIFYDNVSSSGASPAKDSAASSPIPSTIIAPTAQSVAATPAMPQSRWEEVVLAMKDELNMDLDLDDL